jgi:hypothetical protein
MVKVGADIYQRSKTLTEANVAAAYSPLSGLGRSLLGGDLSGLASISSPDALRKFQQAKGTGAPILSSLGGIAAKIGGGAAAGSLAGPWGALAGGVGGLVGAAGDIQSLFQGGPAAAQGKAMAEQIQNLKGENFVTDMLMQHLQSTAGTRQATKLRLGSNWGRMISGGIGLGPMEQLMGQAVGLEQSVGLPAASSMAHTMFSLQKGAAGRNMSTESANTLLSGLSMGTGGPGGANQSAIDLMSTAFQKGFENARVAEEIGKTVGAVMVSSDRVGGSNALNMALANLPETIRANMGRKMDMMDAQHLPGGLKAMESVFHGGGVFESQRLANARALISGTPYGKSDIGQLLVSTMGQMSAQDLMKGNIAPILQAMGKGTSLTGKGVGAETDRSMASGLLNQFKNRTFRQTLGTYFNGPHMPAVMSKILNASNIQAGMASLSPDEFQQATRFIQTRMNTAGATSEDYLMMSSMLGPHAGGKKGVAHGKNLGAGIEAAFFAGDTSRQFAAINAETQDPAIQAALKNSTAIFQATIDIFKTGAEPVNKFNQALETTIGLMNGKTLTQIQHEQEVEQRNRAALNAKHAREEQEKTSGRQHKYGMSH